MSHSTITCPNCRIPLAEKHRSGRKVRTGYIDVVVSAIRAQRLHKDGAVLVCKACGAERFVRLTLADTQSV